MEKSGYNFKEDLRSLAAELRNDDSFANEVYAALCNMQWKSKIDSSIIYSCTWRFAGGLVAEIRNKGERYLDFYLKGNEGRVSDRVRRSLDKLGWEPYPWGEKNG